MTQRGITIAKTPQTCRPRRIPSIKGSLTARNVLKRMALKMMAMVIRVPCHLWGTYDSSLSAIRPWMMPLTMKQTPAR